MTELWVTSIVIGSWVLAAGLVGIVGSFLAERLGDRQLAMQVAEQRFDASSVEPVIMHGLPPGLDGRCWRAYPALLRRYQPDRLRGGF